MPLVFYKEIVCVLVSCYLMTSSVVLVLVQPWPIVPGIGYQHGIGLTLIFFALYLSRPLFVMLDGVG